MQDIQQPIIFEKHDPSECPIRESDPLYWRLLALVITVLTLLIVTGMALLLVTHTLPLFFMLFAALVLLTTGALSLPAAEVLWRRPPLPQAVTVSYTVDENGELIPRLDTESPRR